MYVEFDWDEEKAASNLHKHGISFPEAVTVFGDEDAVFEQDREVDGEARWQVVGLAKNVLLLMVAHTAREEGDVERIRIISARPADRGERERYEREDR